MIRKIRLLKNNKISLKNYRKIMEIYNLEFSNYLQRLNKEVKSKRLYYVQLKS